MRNRYWRVMCVTLALLAISLAGAENPAGLRLNELQYIGTHNSYHIEPDPAVFAMMQKMRYMEGEEWDWQRLTRALAYTHPSLEEQLQLGIRNFELDVYADAEGGRFSRPQALAVAEARGHDLVAPFDPAKKLDEPGFKVFHMADIDVRSSCPLFRECLQQIKRWSDQNRMHVPVIILLEAKSNTHEAIGSAYDATVPEPFTPENWRELEREILSVFLKEQIMTPDSVRGEYESLREAIKAEGWPLVADVLGKVMFVVMHEGPATEAYVSDSPTLAGKLMFVNLPLNHPSASFLLTTKPHKKEEFQRIRRYSKRGYIVYTRGDANTEEARSNTLSRSSHAFLSGAQIVSTDYPYPDYRFSDYKVQFNGGDFVRCNPHVAHEKCQ